MPKGLAQKSSSVTSSAIVVVKKSKTESQIVFFSPFRMAVLLIVESRNLYSISVFAERCSGGNK
jgi:hypothetical protein